jgi:hypothetical protein
MSSPRLTLRERAQRRNRVFARLLEGQTAVAVAAEEGVTPRRVRQMVREALDRWDANPAQDFADLQIARLEAALRPLEQKIAAGDVSVVDKFVKVLGLLDKYHSAQLQVTEDIEDGGDREAAFMEWLERLAASRAAVAARLAASVGTSAPALGAEAAASTPAPSAAEEPASPTSDAPRQPASATMSEAPQQPASMAGAAPADPAALPPPSPFAAEAQVPDREIAAAKEISPLLAEPPRPVQIPTIIVTRVSRA